MSDFNDKDWERYFESHEKGRVSDEQLAHAVNTHIRHGQKSAKSHALKNKKKEVAGKMNKPKSYNPSVAEIRKYNNAPSLEELRIRQKGY